MTEDINALAFLGDAVYELYIREYVIEKGVKGADAMHRTAVRYVRAETQGVAAKKLMQAAEVSDGGGSPVGGDADGGKSPVGGDADGGGCSVVGAGGVPLLNRQELALLKRSRNKKTGRRSRSASKIAYKYATAFEALTGWLYQRGDFDRCREIIRFAIEIAEGKHE